VFKEHVRPRVQEQVNALLHRDFADRTEPSGLSVNAIKSRSFDDPILEVYANDAQVNETRNAVGQLSVVFAIAALEVDGDRSIDARCDAADDPLDEFNRDRFTILIALRSRDRPAASRDRFRASL
jgi:hypothetical protein